MKTKTKIKIALAIVAILVIAFFIFAPSYVDKSNNKTTNKEKHSKNSWYDSIPFIADLHCDELLWDRNLLKRVHHGHVDLPRMQEANVALQVFSIVSKVPIGINIEQNDGNSDQIAWLSFVQLRPISNWFSIKARAINQCKRLHDFAQQSKGQLRIITSQAELALFALDRKANPQLTSAMLGLEGAQPLEGDIKNLNEFYKIGVRYIGLAHFYDNEFAGSAHGMKKGGLTELGKQLIEKMDSLHILIDLAHSSSQTISDVLALHQGPVLISHTGVRGTCDNQRNLSDEQLEEIGKRKGLVGIGLWETAVCGKDAHATAQTIRYVADKIGIDQVALGSDWDGAIEAHFDVTGLPLLVDALEKEKFTRMEIEQIVGGNVKRFFLQNLPPK